MPGRIYLSSAYLPPVEYFSLISRSAEIFIEKEENYIKQTYRNRCYILSESGPQLLSVPALLGESHKTMTKDIRIDYSKRWQQVHLGAIIAGYGSAPYFEYYYGDIEKIISARHNFLIDLNTELTITLLRMSGIKKTLQFTSAFSAPGTIPGDNRYCLAPKKKSGYRPKEYIQVFSNAGSFAGNLSIIDLIFNMGPESAGYL